MFGPGHIVTRRFYKKTVQKSVIIFQKETSKQRMVRGPSYKRPFWCADPEGGRGSGPPSLKNHKAISFLSNTGPDPLKCHKATKPAFNVGQ